MTGGGSLRRPPVTPNPPLSCRTPLAVIPNRSEESKMLPPMACSVTATVLGVSPHLRFFGVRASE